ncbi:MAG: hypothetical protein J5613_03905 [Alphaproteobacteria bacterium]|nr:hypothetical protein [Alphaproteobacteria bacterium]MBR4806287.1 hypothetical protein [Alphaproteobacteria bacterium]
MKTVENVSKILVFFGFGGVAVMSFGLWILPMWFGIHLGWQMGIEAGALMMATFICVLAIGMICLVKSEKK